MSIEITIGGKKENVLKYSLNVRKSLDGSLIVFDHPDVDIIVMPAKKKILVLTNDSLNTSSRTYDVQNQFFKFLLKMGVVLPETIHAGNVYGSMEAIYPELKDTESKTTSVDFVMLAISKWIEQEKPEWEEEEKIKEKEIGRVTDPSNDETTNLGKVPHELRKGNNTLYGTLRESK